MIVVLITMLVGIPLGHAFNIIQPYYVVGTSGQVSLHCTYNIKRQLEEIQVSVYKGMYGQQRICTANVNLSNPYIATEGTVHCRGNVSNGRVDLTIFGLKGEDTDLYRCHMELLYPPPYQTRFGNGTLVYIPESPSCPTEHTEARVQETSDITPTFQKPSLDLILLSAILITTAFTLFLQVMKMILKKRSNPSNQMAQIISPKGSYTNFW